MTRTILTTQTIAQGAAALAITREADHSYRVWLATPTRQLTALPDAQFWTYDAAQERVAYEARTRQQASQ